MTYTGIKIHISDTQKTKLQNSTERILLSFTYDDLMSEGGDEIYLTNTQLNKIKKAIETKKGVKLTISKAQLGYNIKMGGFLGSLAGLAASMLPTIAKKVLPAVGKKVLPALGVGALSGLASTGVNKIFGNGLYLKKGGCVCEIQKQGEGIFLKPYNGRHNFKMNGLYTGDGLYLKKGSGILGDLMSDIPFIGSLF